MDLIPKCIDLCHPHTWGRGFILLGQQTIFKWQTISFPDINSSAGLPQTLITFLSSPLACKGSVNRAGIGVGIAPGMLLLWLSEIISGSYSGWERSKLFCLPEGQDLSFVSSLRILKFDQQRQNHCILSPNVLAKNTKWN